MSKPDHSGIYPRTAAASVICACGVNVPQHVSNGIESDLRDAEHALTVTRHALAVALFWVMTTEGGYTELTKPYYDWALNMIEDIPGDPTAGDVLDAAI